MSAFDLGRFEVLTFDCYGTLIDWEAGILAEVRPLLAASGQLPTDDEVLERYAVHEAALEAGPYQSYRAILGTALRAVFDELGIPLGADAEARFGASVPRWPPFPDSAEALRRLAHRFRLGAITNCDDDLFAASNHQLGDPFEWVVTAQQAGAYKPSHVPFHRALEVIGVSADRILHVAQSVYHDHVPARALGLATVWVNRRHDRSGSGATPRASATPDLIVPNLRTLADMAAGSAG